MYSSITPVTIPPGSPRAKSGPTGPWVGNCPKRSCPRGRGWGKSKIVRAKHVSCQTMTGFRERFTGARPVILLEKKKSHLRAHSRQLAERIIINPMATPTSENLPYPLPQCSLIVTTYDHSDQLRTSPFSFG